MTRLMPMMDRLKRAALIAACLVVNGSLVSSALAQSAFDDPGTKSSGGGAGDLVVVENKVDAGDVALGSSSQVVILFRNDDTKPLNVGDINLYPSSNVSASVAQNQCTGEPLVPEAVCAVAFSVKGLQSGKFRIEILVRHDGRSRLITAAISGNVDASDNTAGQRNSDLETSPETLDFGVLSASRPQARSVLLRNITSQTIEISKIEVQANDQAGYAMDHNCSKLPSGGACVMAVTWSPKQIGPATGSIVVKHNGPTGVANITLTGTYTPVVAAEATVFPDAVPGKGLLVSSLKEINFGTGIEKSSSITVSLVNTGDAPLSIADIRLSNSENGLLIDKAGCAKGRVLNPIEACPMTLTWTPVRAGNILDDVQIAHSGARGVLVLPIRGTAAQAVSKDGQAIVLGDDGDAGLGSIQPLSIEDLEGAIGQRGPVDAGTTPPGAPGGSPRDLSNYKVGDVRGVLDGYSITSLASNKAIISGPGGSRVVFDGENAVIGGVPWVVSVKQGAVQFSHADQSVVLLFDRSLSFVNRNGAQSSESSSVSPTTTEE